MQYAEVQLQDAYCKMESESECPAYCKMESESECPAYLKD